MVGHATDVPASGRGRLSVTRRPLIALFVAAVLAAAAWIVLQALHAERADAAVLGGPEGLALPIGEGLGTLLPGAARATDGPAGEVTDALPAVGAITDPLLGSIGDSTAPVGEIVAPVVDVVETIVPPNLVPPILLPSNPILPDAPPAGPIPPVGAPGAGPPRPFSSPNPAVAPGRSAVPATPVVARAGPGAPTAPEERPSPRLSSITSRSARSGSVPHGLPEPALPQVAAPSPNAPSGQAPVGPRAPVGPVPDVGLSGAPGGNGLRALDATLVAPVVVAAAGAFALARARRVTWSDWVALADARPG